MSISRPTALLRVFAAATALLAFAPSAWAHCDTLSGPVVKAARVALDTKDLQPVLKWVKPEAEAELREAFDSTLAVRSQGAKAQQLADRYFFETTVRLHRAGEGAPYSGLKAEPPAGLIAASDHALDERSLEPLLTATTAKVASGLQERYKKVMEAKQHADHNVEAGRRFVAAYVEYVHFVEALQSIIAASPGTPEAGHRHGQ